MQKWGEWFSYYKSGNLLKKEIWGKKYPTHKNFLTLLTREFHSPDIYKEKGMILESCNHFNGTYCLEVGEWGSHFYKIKNQSYRPAP